MGWCVTNPSIPDHPGRDLNSWRGTYDDLSRWEVSPQINFSVCQSTGRYTHGGGVYEKAYGGGSGGGGGSPIVVLVLLR